MARDDNRIVYQLKVVLQDVHPPIWRRIEIWDDTTLSQLHRILQVAMGWEDRHLHEFHIAGQILPYQTQMAIKMSAQSPTSAGIGCER